MRHLKILALAAGLLGAGPALAHADVYVAPQVRVVLGAYDYYPVHRERVYYPDHHRHYRHRHVHRHVHHYHDRGYHWRHRHRHRHGHWCDHDD
jgi:hypothetical protein